MDKLSELEKDSRKLLNEIKSKADVEDMEIILPELDLVETQPGLMRRRIPSWVAVAAMVAGLAIGFILPEHRTIGTNRNTAYNYADTCCSIAQNDVNLSLLVTSL